MLKRSRMDAMTPAGTTDAQANAPLMLKPML